MEIRSKKVKSIFILAILIIILSLSVAVAIPSISISQSGEKVMAAAVTAGTPSVVNLDEKGVAKDYFSSIITGGQNEYIYLGTNVTSTTANTPGANNSIHTGAIKWRVLSANDTKYSSGNMLLWSDYQLGSAQYNLYYNNPYFAYWGTSMLRAKLNGGTYLNTVSNTTTVPALNQTVAEGNSWLHQIFNANERSNIVKSTTYDTKLWGYDGTGTKTYKTTGIVGTGNGQYSTTSINGVAGTYASQSGTSVIEKTADSLFLLDYYDINNVDYGFGDSGTVYANKLDSSWTSSSDGYPGYYYNGNNGSTTSDYLKFSGDITNYYWFRPAGRNSSSYSISLYVYSGGYVITLM